MGKSRRLVRLRLFKRGNIRCPICLTEFTRHAVKKGKTVTLEHVPPRSLSPNSRGRCLTCRKCNEGAGRGIDQIAYELEKDPKTTVEIKGVPHTGRIEFCEDNHLRIMATTSLRVPLEDLRRLGNNDFKVRMTAPNERIGSISWLKSAYLNLFCLLGVHGYRYAESSVGSLVRRQILNPKEVIISNFKGAASDDWALEDGIFMHIDDPKLWVVKMGDKGVFLPRTDDDLLYRNLGEFKENYRFEFRNGYYWKQVKFGENIVGSFVVDDWTALDKVTKGDPFGFYARVRLKDKERHFAIADYGSDFLTVLLLKPESVGA